MRRQKDVSKSQSPRPGEIMDYLNTRFGLEPELFSEYTFYLGSKGRVFLGPRASMNNLRIATVGLLVARVNGAIKPTTNLLQIFGNQVKSNVVTLEKKNALAFIKGSDVVPSTEEIGLATDGYVLLRYLHFSLGCGLLRDGKIKNMLPKAKRLEVKFF